MDRMELLAKIDKKEITTVEELNQALVETHGSKKKVINAQKYASSKMRHEGMTPSSNLMKYLVHFDGAMNPGSSEDFGQD